jgi:hypothetical protein
LSTPNIRLVRFGNSAASILPDTKIQAWALSVQATGTGMPGEIFVYHKGSENDPIPGDKFECIASVSQLEEIPKGTPTTTIPYYRVSQADFICRSASEADEIWETIKSEVQTLISNFQDTATLDQQESGVVDAGGWTPD